MKKVITFFVLLCSIWSGLLAQCPTPPNLSVVGGPYTINCASPTATLFSASATPMVTFAWTGPNGFTSTLSNPVVTQAGVYTIVVTEPINGCTETANVLVIGDVTVPNLASTPQVFACNGPTTLFATSTTPGVTWAWSTGSTQSSTVVSQAGLYSVTVTGLNGCTQTGMVEVFLGTGVPPTASVPPNLLLTCNTPSLVVPITTQPAGCIIRMPNGTFLGGNQMQIGLPGTFSMTIIDPVSGCSSPFSFTVGGSPWPLAVSIVTSDISCNGLGTLTPFASGSSLSYNWSNGATTNQLSTNIPGAYTVTVTDNITGCSNSAFGAVALDLNTLGFTATNPFCTGETNGSIHLDTIPNLEILWGNNSTLPMLENLAPGQYCVTVTNPDLGCEVDSCIFIIEPLPLVVTITATGNCGFNSGVAVANISGGAPSYEVQWSNGASQPVIGNLAGGTYTVTVTDQNGCTSTNSILVGGNILLTPYISYNDCSAIVTVVTNSIQAPYSYAFSNGLFLDSPSNLVSVPNLAGGSYTVTVTDNAGCTAVTSFTVLPPDCDQLLEGHLRKDLNANCVSDPNEDALGAWIIRAVNTSTQDDYYSLTNTQGFYSIALPVGNYLVDAIPISNIWQSCPAQAVSFAGPDTLTLDLSAQALFDCPIMDVNISAGLIRRCFEGFYSVNYCNLGTTTATDVYILVELDPLLTFQSATFPVVGVGNNTYRFNIGTVPAGACGVFGITANVSCNATLGQTHCSQAHIFPDTLCFPAPTNWSGASVEARAFCIGDSVRFTISNNGSGTMTNQLEYIVIEDGILRQSGTGAPLAPGGTMQVAVPANGSTWRLEVTQEPNHPVLPNAIVNREGCVQGNQPFSTGFVTQFVLPDSMPWLDIDCTPNIGAYDPNDKGGMPEGYGAQHYIEPDTRIDYLIRFQNTGTDTAFTVVITDTLSSLLDPRSFRFLGASHPVVTKLSGRGELEFRFNQIMLPDSNVNEPASHGFARFSIAPRPGLPLETDVHNEASIYFDFNDAIVTNRTQHRFGRDFVIVRLFEIDETLEAAVQPNPVAHQVLVRWNDMVEFELTVTDLLGRVVAQQFGFGDHQTLNVSDWESGVYQINVRTADGKNRIAKVMKVE